MHRLEGSGLMVDGMGVEGCVRSVIRVDTEWREMTNEE